MKKIFAVLCTVAAMLATTSSPAFAGKVKEPVAHVEWKPTDVKDGGGSANYATSQWNLDRIDQRNRPLDGQYNPVYGFGNGVNVYVVDSGVRISHTQFQGRAKNGWDFIDNDAVAQDCLGHGTHVAGTVAGVNTGSARYANIIAVRVLNCDGDGSQSQVVNGLNWVRYNHVKPAVVNISIGFDGGNSAVDTAVQQLINAGVTVVTSAGNNGYNACNNSPARVSTVLTVGNANSSDTRNSASNFGSCLDLFAPGTSITSTCKTSDTATCSMTGTSMSSPLVAGAAALYLRFFPTASNAQVASWILGRTTNGLVTSPGSGSPNRLLYVGA